MEDTVNDPGLDLETPVNGRRQVLVSWLPVLLVGFIGTWLFHIAQFASRFDMFPGDRGDARLVTYLLEHWYQVFRGNDNWLSPRMFYPVKGVMAYADLFFGYSLPYSILRTFGLGMFEASEFTLIFLNFLNYLVCFILLRKILRFNAVAACAAAFFFAFNSPKIVQMGHFQLQPVLFLPLAIMLVVMVVQRMENLSLHKAFILLCLAALSLDLQLLSGFYLGWFFMLWCLLFVALVILFTRTRLFLWIFVKKFWPAIAGASLVFTLGLMPFFLAYLPLFRASGGRTYEEVRQLIPVFWSLLVMGERNYVWGTFSAAIKRTHPLHPELQIGIGLIPSLAWVAITMLAIWLIGRNRKTSHGSRQLLANNKEHDKTTQMLLALLVLATTAFYLLGMRYWNNYSPWEFIYSHFPGAQGIRAVARYVIFLTLPMAIAFAFVIDRAMTKISFRNSRPVRITMYAVLFGVIAFGLGEQFARKRNFNGFSVKAEKSYLKNLSSALPGNCSAFYVSIGPDGQRHQFEYQVDAALVSIMTHVPTLNGYSGQLPPNWPLWEVKAPDYEANVKAWIDANHLQGNICRLVIDEPVSKKNPMDDAAFFVRQQYLDLLARDPDTGGADNWSRQLAQCPMETDLNCGRVQVSFAILKSEEFQKRSNFVYLLYDATLGRPPRYQEFIADREKIIVSQAPAQEAASKETLLSEWIKRNEFRTRYEKLADADFVDKLSSQAGITLSNRNELIADLENKRKQRVDVLREVLESKTVAEKFSNRSLVAMQFLGFLRRDPKPSEFSERLTTLEATENYRQLIFDFIYSTEYRQRFGPVN
jgi:hypothetical protein